MPSDPRLEPVVVSLAGREHEDWTEYEIDSDLLTPADAWRVELGVPTAKSPTLALWSQVRVRLGGETVLVGRIDGCERYTVKGERRLTLRGRDLAGVLCDCSAPIFSAREVDLASVVATITRPLGISRVRMEASGRREKVSIEPGMTAWDALRQVCELNGCWPWFAPDGALIVGGPDYTAAPVGELVLDPSGDETNVKSLTVAHDAAGLYSEVTVLGQSHGTPSASGRHDIKAVAVDSAIAARGIRRPLVSVEGDCDSQDMADRRARKMLADGRLSALTITAEVRGHGPVDGLHWTPGQRVRVVSPADRLDGTYFLMRRTFRGDIKGGQATTLVLKEDGVWTPDSGRRRRGKKQNGPLRVVDL